MPALPGHPDHGAVQIRKVFLGLVGRECGQIPERVVGDELLVLKMENEKMTKRQKDISQNQVPILPLKANPGHKVHLAGQRAGTVPGHLQILSFTKENFVGRN